MTPNSEHPSHDDRHMDTPSLLPKSELSSTKKMSQEEIDAWQDARIKDLWRVFRVLGEFVDGFETLSEIGPCVSIFGSARTKEGDPSYELGRSVAASLVNGFVDVELFFCPVPSQSSQAAQSDIDLTYIEDDVFAVFAKTALTSDLHGRTIATGAADSQRSQET